MPPGTRIQPYPGNNETIERVAKRFRDVMGIPPECRIAAERRLAECVTRTGGEIRVLESPASFQSQGGSLIIDGPGKYTIFLSPYTTPLRDNFTVAHELGHYILHYTHRRNELGPGPIVFARYGTDPFEWQANRFAAALLMPKEQFKEDYRRFRGDAGLLAGTYGVSLPAARIRCESLELAEPVDQVAP